MKADPYSIPDLYSGSQGSENGIDDDDSSQYSSHLLRRRHDSPTTKGKIHPGHRVLFASLKRKVCRPNACHCQTSWISVKVAASIWVLSRT